MARFLNALIIGGGQLARRIGVNFPVPVFTVQPSITGSPIAGNALAGAPGVATSSVSLALAWLRNGTAISGANGAAYVVQAADVGKQLALQVTATGPGGTTVATSAAITGVAYVASSATPTPSFTAQPTITGTAQVGSVASFTPGTVTNGTIATVRLRKDGADYADASSGSFQWSATGSYVVRSTIAGTSVYADSAAVTVVAAVTAAVPAPTIAIATTNADGSAYAAGTNPPRIVLSVPQTLDKTAYRALLYYDQANSGAVATDPAHTLTIEDLMTAGDAEGATFSAFGSLAAGPLRCQAVFQNKADSSFSPLSTVLTTTLNAKALPAATTTFDPANESQFATVSSDYRSFTGNPNDGRFASAAFSATRSDARYWEMTVTAVDQSTNGSDYTGGGITTVDDKMPTAGVPTSNIAYAGNSGYPAGTVYSFEAIPATAGNSDGSFKVWINGALQATKGHSLTSYLPYALCFRDDTLKLNAGQEAFAYPNLSTALRFN